MPVRLPYPALLYLHQRVEEAFGNNKVVVIAFLDIAKAYDCVWHDALRHKLIRAGVSGRMLRWISDFLRDRRGRAVYQGEFSG